MKHARGRSDGQPTQYGTGTFTGKVLLDPVLAAGNARINSVMFEPGGRTYWHSHDDGQVLIVGTGRGMVATRDGEQHVLVAGDTVYAPPGEEHLHALPAQRVKRVRDDYESRKITGRPGTMPLPWGYPAAACCHQVSGCPRAWPARDGTCPRAGPAGVQPTAAEPRTLPARTPG